MAEDKNIPSGANKYSIYAQRSVEGSQVDWAKIAGDLTKGAEKIRDERQGRKDAIEKEVQNSLEQLSKIPETGTQDASSLMINGSAMSVKAIQTNADLIRRGLRKPKDGLLFMQEQKNGYANLSKGVQAWDKWAVTAKTRIQEGVASGQEIYNNLSVEALGNLSNKQLLSNPINGKLELVTMIYNKQSKLFDIMPDYDKNPENFQNPNIIPNIMKNQENKIDVNTMAKKQTAVIADIVQTYVDGPKYNVLDGGGGLSSISDFRQLGNFGTKEDGTAVTYDEWKTDQINAMVGGVNDIKNQKAGQVLYNSGKYFYASSLSQFKTLHPDVDVKYWLNSSNATGVPITTLNAEQMKAARGLADTAIESQVKHIEKVAAAAKSGQQERPLSQANINKDKDDAMLIGFMDGVNSLVSDDASKFDAEANDRIVALNKGQTDPARRIDSIVRDDDEILITYQNGKVEPVNRLDDNGNPKSARVISQELWRFVTDQSDDSFKYAADIYAKEQGGGFRSTTRESTAEEDRSFIANERAVEAVGPAPVLVELEGKPTNFEINKNAETFKKETDAYALKLKDEIELQGGKVTAEELDTMKRLILTGGDASKYASLAPFAEVTASSQQTMIQGTGKGATMVTPTEYLKDKLSDVLSINDSEADVQSSLSEVFTNFLPKGFKNGAKLKWDDSKNQVIITYKNNQNNDVKLPPIQMEDTKLPRTTMVEVTEMLRKAAVEVLKVENEIRTSRNRKGTRKTRVSYENL
tara:strand:+ start:1372 stop:3627 length:2256 start_codon:yes stop_codon:yes gene_type:complete